MQTTIDTTISNVTVYPDRARVTRRGSAELSTATTTLLIEQLPMTVNVESLRVSGRGAAKVRILSVDVTKKQYRETPAEKVQLLETQVAELERNIAAKDDARAVQERQITYVAGLMGETRHFAKAIATGQAAVTSQIELLDFVQTRESALREAIRAIEFERSELERTRQHIAAQLTELRSQRRLQRLQAVISVEVLSDGPFSAEISYVVSRASWTPLYDLRFSEASGDITLTALAQVSQQSGEDWNDVALTLSTARPALNQTMPKLSPIYVDERRPRPVAMAAPAVMARSQMRKKSAPVAEAVEARHEETAVVVEADITSSGATVTFNASGSSNIPGDGSTRKNTLATFNLTPEIDYVSIPRRTDSVFRRATLVNSTPTPLLTGSLNLFVDDEFIGQNRLPFTPRGDKLELLLGVEERITVERKLTRRDVDKRLLRDRRLTRTGYAIALNNLLDKGVTVTVEDQIPTSRHESIKINMESIKPQPVEQTPLNLVKWRLKLDPKGSQTISFEFSAEHPRDMVVVGLDQ